MIESIGALQPPPFCAQEANPVRPRARPPALVMGPLPATEGESAMDPEGRTASHLADPSLGVVSPLGASPLTLVNLDLGTWMISLSWNAGFWCRFSVVGPPPRRTSGARGVNTAHRSGRWCRRRWVRLCRRDRCVTPRTPHSVKKALTSPVVWSISRKRSFALMPVGPAILVAISMCALAARDRRGARAVPGERLPALSSKRTGFCRGARPLLLNNTII